MIKSFINKPAHYLLVASFQTYLIYHIYTKMSQVDQMRHMMDKIYTEQLNLKSNPKFTQTRDISTNTLTDIEIISPPPSPPNKDDIPQNSFFSLGSYLNQKKEKE